MKPGGSRPSNPTRPRPGPRPAALVGLLLAVGAAYLSQRFVLDLELMGWDSYPIIAASRIDGLSDLLGSFSEELMDGRYPEGRFYRPVTNLVFAFDHAVSGLRPVGYQRTNLLLHLAGVVSVLALGRRWLGPGWGCAVAALVFAVHPLQLETVPVAARRADMLFTLLLVLALLAQPLGEGASRRRLAAGALLVLLSAASKETGAVALPVVLGALWILPARGDGGARLRRSLRLGALPALAFALFVALRTWVLGGIGGHEVSAPLSGAVLGLFRAPAFARSLVMPQPWTTQPLLDGGLFIALVVGLGAALHAVTRGEDGGPADAARRPPPRRLVGFLGLWLLCLLAMTGLSSERASWYAAPFVPAYALLLGLLADGAARTFRTGRRAAALAAGGLALVLLASHLRYSTLFHHYDAWTLLSRQESDFLARFRTAVVEAAPGTTVEVTGLPLGTGTPLEQVGIRSALGMTDYSVAAWSELALPEHPVRVRLHAGGPPSAPAPGTVTVDAVPLPSPALRLPPGASQ